MQTAFVTGADKGLGLSLVVSLLARGYRVFAGHFGDGAALQDLATRHVGRVLPVPQDVTNSASVKRSAEIVLQQTVALDLLINCAGVCFEDVHRKILETEMDSPHVERTMSVNAFGPMRVIQAFLPLVEKGAGKKIANISSEAGSIGANWRNYGYIYCMSKAAVNMMSQILQKELEPKGIKVFIFHPGWMRTDMGGPTAHISAEVASEGICGLIHQAWKLNDPMYMDYTGKLFPW